MSRSSAGVSRIGRLGSGQLIVCFGESLWFGSWLYVQEETESGCDTE